VRRQDDYEIVNTAVGTPKRACALRSHSRARSAPKHDQHTRAMRPNQEDRAFTLLVSAHHSPRRAFCYPAAVNRACCGPSRKATPRYSACSRRRMADGMLCAPEFLVPPPQVLEQPSSLRPDVQGVTCRWVVVEGSPDLLHLVRRVKHGKNVQE
jgi:hypothetical protein